MREVSSEPVLTPRGAGAGLARPRVSLAACTEQRDRPRQSALMLMSVTLGALPQLSSVHRPASSQVSAVIPALPLV